MSEYPTELERPGLLRDGGSILIRPATLDDTDRMLDFSSRLSRRTIAFRMLGPVVMMDRETTARFLDTDHHDRLVLFATLDDDVIGVADYTRSQPGSDRAAIGFIIDDSHQRRGLGGLLLEHLAAAARDRSIAVFEADVLADNVAMQRTLQSSGYSVLFEDSAGSVQHIEVAVDPRRQVLARSDRRERSANRSSLLPFFAPHSVAVIGASRTKRTVGNAILHNLRSRGFGGSLYAVNPHAAEIDGVASVASVRDIPDPPDLAVIAVPADAVLDVLAECSDVGVGAVIVVSTEMSGPGSGAREMLKFVRGHGMRLVGPNCMGVLSLRSGIDLVATFSPAIPPPGRVSMASQSGPLGLAILDHARRLGLGFNGFVSLGNSVDVSPNDLLQWWDTDRSTGVVMLQLDTFGNPRKFVRIARRLAARKPIIAVHPGSEMAYQPVSVVSPYPTDSDAVLSALFAQTGVIRTRTMQEMFDAALLLAFQPIPPGPRVAILTNAEGPGALTAGACRGAGLVLAGLSDETLATLGGPDQLEFRNPVDLTPRATGADYGRAMRALLDDHGVDAVIVLFVPPLVDESDSVAAELVAQSARTPNKPVVSSFLSKEGMLPELRIDAQRAIPSYLFPESAATALGHAAGYGDWLRLPGGVTRGPAGFDIGAARAIVAAHDSTELSTDVCDRLLLCFDLHRADNGPDGQDLTLQVVDDPIFGPVIVLGAAGPYARLYDDVAHRITPVTDKDARAMIGALRTYPILAGRLDRPAVDLDALAETITTVSTMVEQLPELSSLVVERLRVGVPGAGVTLLDSTVRLSHRTASRATKEAISDRT